MTTAVSARQWRSPNRFRGSELKPAELEVEEANRRTWRWLLRATYYAVASVAGCAWLARDDQPFLSAFALQTVAGFLFSGLILASIFAGMAVGSALGRIHFIIGLMGGLIVGVALFMGGWASFRSAPCPGSGNRSNCFPHRIGRRLGVGADRRRDQFGRTSYANGRLSSCEGYCVPGCSVASNESRIDITMSCKTFMFAPGIA